MAFQYGGSDVENSSQLSHVNVGQARILRDELWRAIIKEHFEKLPHSEHPVYIATGGGYGSFNALINQLKAVGEIDPNIPVLKGDDFRNHPAFDTEKEDVKEEIRKHLEAIEASNPADQQQPVTDEDVNKILTAFYSDEVNTKFVKGVTINGEISRDVPRSLLLRAITEGKSVIHESAFIYPEDVVRPAMAKEGSKTVLIAGDCDMDGAIARLPHILPKATATSFKRFASRFESELVPAFDQIKLYNSDSEPPKLIAIKRGKGQELEVLEPALYHAFLAKKDVDVEKYASRIDESNVIQAGHQKATYNPILPEGPKQDRSV